MCAGNEALTLRLVCLSGAALLIQYEKPEILWGKTLILWKKAGLDEKVMFFMCIMTDNCYWRQSDQAHGKAGKNKLFFRFLLLNWAVVGIICWLFTCILVFAQVVESYLLTPQG